MKYFWGLLFLLIPLATQARVFNIDKETAAAYFMMTGAGSQMGTNALNGESGAGVSFSGGTNYNYSGEFGFLYSRPYASLRFGLEIFKPSLLNSGATSGGTDLYSAQSDIMGFAPKISLEVNLNRGGSYRSFIALMAGAASITMKNDYVLTAAGQSAYPGVVDHSIEAKGSATLMAATLGYEGLLTDTTTIFVEFGYRQLKFESLKYTKDVTTFSGAKVSGDALVNAAGEPRSLDFSGGFIGLGFRFFL